MIARTRSLLKTAESGQGMTEYIIIVALIAIGSIAIITVFGQNLRNLFAMSTNALAGEDNQTNSINTSYTAGRRNLKNFGEENL